MKLDVLYLYLNSSNRVSVRWLKLASFCSKNFSEFEVNQSKDLQLPMLSLNIVSIEDPASIDTASRLIKS